MSDPRPVGGSFRDPAARVYADGPRILRGVDTATLEAFGRLAGTRFLPKALEAGRIVSSRALPGDDPAARAILSEGWAGVLEHERVPFISYPYEWTFSMLKDAALLHLELLESALQEGWTLKDSTPFNVQFDGSRPVFIDVPSFAPRPAGDYWRGYRQFCMAFLYPLMLASHKGIAFQPLLRSSLEGIEPVEAARFFGGMDVFRRGVLAHVRFPARLERWAQSKAPTGAPAAPQRPQSDAMVVGLVQSMRRLVESLNPPSDPSAWSDYARTHSYDEASTEDKKAFVAAAAAEAKAALAWDLGANTGVFSEILAQSCGHVVSVDSDHASVERLYQRLREGGERRILPLVMNLANPSPAQGWAGVEREAFDRRNKPDLVVALALIHHMGLSANVPIPAFLDWLAATGARLVIEFVDREDAMAKEMLSRKTEPHADYNLASFERELGRRYEVLRTQPMKAGRRRIYDCVPRR